MEESSFLQSENSRLQSLVDTLLAEREMAYRQQKIIPSYTMRTALINAAALYEKNIYPEEPDNFFQDAADASKNAVLFYDELVEKMASRRKRALEYLNEIEWEILEGVAARLIDKSNSQGYAFVADLVLRNDIKSLLEW